MARLDRALSTQLIRWIFTLAWWSSSNCRRRSVGSFHCRARKSETRYTMRRSSPPGPSNCPTAAMASSGPAELCDTSNGLRTCPSRSTNSVLVTECLNISGAAPRATPEKRKRVKVGLRLDLACGFGADPLHNDLRLVEGAAIGPAIRHREAVVQKHDVVGFGPSEPRPELVLQQGLGHQQHDRGDGGHPQQQQQQLLQHDPGSVLLLAQQQELHRRPPDAPVPEHADQVDQHGDPDQRESPKQRWVNERRHGGSAPSVLSRSVTEIGG